MPITPEQAEQILNDIKARLASNKKIGLETFDDNVGVFREAVARELNAAEAIIIAGLQDDLAPFIEVPLPPSPVPLKYDAPTHRNAISKQTLPFIGPAGSWFTDNQFNRSILRTTDANTCLANPNIPGRSYRTPSSVHARAWSADSRRFYVVSTHGNIIPFTWDGERAQRDGAEVRMMGEPNFHPVKPTVLVGAPNSTTAFQILEHDVVSRTMNVLIDLQELVSVNLASPRTYVGDTGISGDGKRVFAFFGGTGQDKHQYIAVLDVPSGKRWLLDTVAGTVNGTAALEASLLGAHIHSASMDKTGRFIKISWATADNKGAGPYWDVDNNYFFKRTANTGGHDAYGYGVRVNNAATQGEAYDAAQWQLRVLDAAVDVTRPLIAPQLTPKRIYSADHPSWHNAQPDRLVPFISGFYRYYVTEVDMRSEVWRAWDDEIIAVQTDVPASQGATVWRFCHHRSDISKSPLAGGTNYTGNYFWYYPRPQVSPDGTLVLFTSNMEKTLGLDPKAEEGGRHRTDVFLVRLV